MAVDPFRLLVALGPLAVYLFVIGLINAAKRPIVVSGVRDTIGLGLALAGLMIVGPLEMFMPQGATSLFGPFIWLLLISFYALIVTFILLNERPRIIVYNVPAEVLRPLVAQVAQSLDSDSRWAGDTLALPALGVELRLEVSTPLRNVSLVANGDRQSIVAWQVLRRSLRAALRPIRVPRNLNGFVLIATSLFVMAMLLWTSAANPDAVAQNLAQLLRLQ